MTGPQARTPDLERVARRYAHAVQVGDDAAAQATVRAALEEDADPVEILTDVLTPAMYHVGSLWQEGLMSIAEEHLATAITERALAIVYPALFTAPPLRREPVVIAAVENEHHVLGARMAADVLEGRGFAVAFLGANVSTERLLDAVESHEARIVGLTCTMPTARPALVATTAALIRDPELRIVVGGAGVPASLAAPASGGGDGRLTRVSDVREALAVLASASRP